MQEDSIKSLHKIIFAASQGHMVVGIWTWLSGNKITRIAYLKIETRIDKYE